MESRQGHANILLTLPFAPVRYSNTAAHLGGLNTSTYHNMKLITLAATTAAIAFGSIACEKKPDEKIKESVDKAVDSGKKAVEAAKEAGAGAVDKAKEAGAAAVDKAKEAGEAAKEAGAAAIDKAKEAGAAAVENVKEAGAAAIDKAKEAVTPAAPATPPGN